MLELEWIFDNNPILSKGSDLYGLLCAYENNWGKKGKQCWMLNIGQYLFASTLLIS